MFIKAEHSYQLVEFLEKRVRELEVGLGGSVRGRVSDCNRGEHMFAKR